MHPAHQFIQNHVDEKSNLDMFSVDLTESEDLIQRCKVSPEYAIRIKQIYATRVANASYDAKWAYSDDGEPLFLDESGELIDGIYIGIPNEIYHSLPTLSSTMVKKYKTAPALYKRAYIDKVERKRSKTTEYTLDAGTYSHELVLEPEGFSDSYYRGVIANEYPKALDSMEELRAKAKELGLKGASKDALVKAIREKDASVLLFKDIEAEHDEFYSDKERIDPVVYDDAIRCAHSILTHEDAAPLLCPDEGLPEVSLIYNCPVTGLKKRTRFDFLRFDNIAVDVKTTRSTDQSSFTKDVINMGYGIQEVMYRESYCVLTGQELDAFVFVTGEYNVMDACETFVIADVDFNDLFDVYIGVMVNLSESLETNIWTGYSDNQKRKSIVKPSYLRW